MKVQEQLARLAYGGYRDFKNKDPLVSGRDGEFPEFDGLAPTEILAWESAGEALAKALVAEVADRIFTVNRPLMEKLSG